MVTFVLPGYSSHNQEWSTSIAKSLEIGGDIRPIFWDHWQDEAKRFNPEEKARLLSDLAPNIFVNIVAKSVGTLVAAYMIKRLPEQVKKVIFCGIPVNDLSDDDIEVIKDALGSFKGEVVIYQNEHDPHGSPKQAEIFGKVVTKPRDDHEYPYIDDFNKFLKD